jgi:hypothetical protein
MNQNIYHAEENYADAAGSHQKSLESACATFPGTRA